MQSTLSQVRSKGINRGGLYGFFVKGEGLTGTISSTEESSAAEASNSSALSAGVSTPPTSASDSDSAPDSSEDSDTASEASQMSKKKNNKRKRGKEEEDKGNKKLKIELLEESVANPPPPEVTTILGTLSLEEMQRINSVMRIIGREVKVTLNTNAKKGVYGVWIDPNKLKGKKKGMTAIHFDDPDNPGQTITYKKAKFNRQRKMREAKKELLKDRVVSAMMKGTLPNPEGWTRDEARSRYVRIENALLTIEKGERKIRKSGKDKEKLVKAKEKEVRKRIAKEQRELEKKAQQEADEAKKQAIISIKLAKLTPEEKATYEARAAEKEQTLDEYILRRAEKNKRKKAAKEAELEAKKKLGFTSDALFFEDTEGDAIIAQALAPVTYTPLPDGSCPLDPTIWEGRVVKDLPKEVRAARRKWLEERRRQKKIASGKLKENGKDKVSRQQKKMAAIGHITREILQEMGVPEGATKEQRNLARSRAKKLMKTQKRERTHKGGIFKLVENKKGRHRASETMKARVADAAAELKGVDPATLAAAGGINAIAAAHAAKLWRS